jgi:opacity protein-like surface antigen
VFFEGTTFALGAHASAGGTSMRVLLSVIVATVCSAPAAFAQDRSGFVQGFGGLRLATVGAGEGAFGAVMGGSLTPNVQVVGEVGRLGNVLPTTVDTLLAFSPIDFHVSAWYGQAGVRFTGGSSAVRPYVETSAGIARLHSNLGTLGSPLLDALTRAGLGLFDRTEPMATVGGGIAFERGPFIADVGYRYRRIFTSSDLVDVLSIGQRLDNNEVRFGVGVRF